MNVGDLLICSSMYQFGDFKPGDTFIVLSFFQVSVGYTASWHNVSMVRVLTRFGVQEMTMSSLLKGTLEAKT